MPFLKKPQPKQWEFCCKISELHRERPIDLLVIDPLASVLPGSEEGSAAAMTDLLRPLRDFAMNKTGVLLLHHPRKGVSLGRQAARGKERCPRSSTFSWKCTGPGHRSRRTVADACLPGRDSSKHRVN